MCEQIFCNRMWKISCILSKIWSTKGTKTRAQQVYTRYRGINKGSGCVTYKNSVQRSKAYHRRGFSCPKIQDTYFVTNERHGNKWSWHIIEREMYYLWRSKAKLSNDFFLIYRWEITEVPYALYKLEELTKQHKNFGHPSVKETEGLVKRENSCLMESNDHKALKEISNDHDIWKTSNAAPRSFRLTAGTENFRFNLIVHSGGKNVLRGKTRCSVSWYGNPFSRSRVS